MTWWARFRNGATTTAPSVFAGYESTFRTTQASLTTAAGRLVNPCERYAVLRAYYQQNQLYQALGRALYEAGIWNPAMRNLRGPAFRIVEAHVAHLWPGDLPAALPIVTENARLLDPIHQVWRWSNWAANKQVFARSLAMLGDVFVKVVRPQDANGQAAGRVYFQLLDPAHVTDFDTDERGNLTYARIEVPQRRRVGDKTEGYLHVEIWSKADQTYRRWEVDELRRELLDAERMPPPDEEIPLARMGIDFVPIVACQFMNVGEDRGVSAYLLQLDKIDAVNQDATRLAQMLFRHNKATWALHGIGNDAAGRPLVPPAVPTSGTNTAGREIVSMEDDELYRLPGTAQLTPLVPNLQYEAHRMFNNDGLLDLQRDCPAMAWATVMELGGELSGRALKYKLAPFESQVREVRGNAEDALARLDAMALTIGSAAPALFGEIGSFDQGDYEHAFEPREVIPVSEYEDAQADQLKADAAGKKLTAGWSQRGVWREAGLSDTDIELMETEKATLDVIPTESQ